MDKGAEVVVSLIIYMAIKVGMVSLGCSKNQVDAEIMLADMKNNGFELCGEPGLCDVVIINTCGFIQSAKEEAIEEILEFVSLKNEGRIKVIAVTGCLAQRYQDEILKEIPEVDVVLGIGSNKKLAQAVKDALNDKKVTTEFGDRENLDINGERVLTTLPFYAYIKIAEGCDNCCSYCAIPHIRGKFRSRKKEDIINEARWLADQGVKELVVVAQDTTRYGEDLYGKYSLAELLESLCEIEQLKWIRILYCYPDKITDELLEVMANNKKIAKYIDIPIQHCNGEILSAMNRSGSQNDMLELINRIRNRVPGITIRTTLITGFPGETDEHFEQLDSFVKMAEFDRLGCFAYSAEEGTKAADMQNQIDEDVKARRAEIIMDTQGVITSRKNDALIGKDIVVIVEGFDKYGPCYFGRSEADAPDIDGKIFFTSENQHTMGDFVTVHITEACDYDLIGECE